MEKDTRWIDNESKDTRKDGGLPPATSGTSMPKVKPPKPSTEPKQGNVVRDKGN